MNYGFNNTILIFAIIILKTRFLGVETEKGRLATKRWVLFVPFYIPAWVTKPGRPKWMQKERRGGFCVQLNDMFKATGLVDRFRFWFSNEA